MNRFSRNGRFPWLKWGDFLLVGLIGGLAAALFLMGPTRVQGATNTAAVLTHNGQVLLSISGADLQKSDEKEIDVNGFHYRLVWETGRIRFAESNCPDKVCVRTGWISRPNEIAVCVPGRVILKIEGNADARPNPSELDVIAR